MGIKKSNNIGTGKGIGVGKVIKDSNSTISHPHASSGC